MTLVWVAFPYPTPATRQLQQEWRALGGRMPVVTRVLALPVPQCGKMLWRHD